MLRRLSGAFIVLLVLNGCGDPTADKPAAEVSGPAVLEQAPDGDVALEATATPPVSGVVHVFTDDSGIDFEGFKVSGSHVGGFGKFTGSVTIPEGDIEGAHIEIEIDTTSLYSDDPGLTTKLKSSDFFDVETYPIAAFRSVRILTTGDGYDVTGNFELHGVTKQITFPASIELRGDTLTAEAEFTINRFDWNIMYSGLADDLIRDDVLILFEIEAKPEPS